MPDFPPAPTVPARVRFDYLIFYDSYYTAIDYSGIVKFGGQNDAGGIDGSDAASVVNACFNALPNGGLVFLFDPILTTSSLLAKDNVRLVTKSVVGSAGAVSPNITYSGSDYAIREADEDSWKNFAFENLAIHNSNPLAKGHIRAGKCDFATLKGICVSGYATESAINIPYSSLKGNTKELKNIRIESEYHIAIGLDIQADHIYADDIVISKTTSAAVRVGDQSQEEALYNCHLNNIHGYNCQHRFLDIQWSYYLLGTKLQDEHDAAWVGTKESSWHQAAGKTSKNNLLIDCISAYNVEEGHPPAPYIEILDESGDLVFVRSDSPAWGDASLGLKVIPRLIIDDNGRGTPDLLTLSSTHADLIRLRNSGVKDVIMSVDATGLKIWNVTDEQFELLLKWGAELNCYNLIPFANEAYNLGDPTHKWINAYLSGFLDAISLKIGGTEVISSGRLLHNVDIDVGCNFPAGIKVNGTLIVTAGRTLQAVDIDASGLNRGTVPDARLSGATESVTVRNAAGDGTITLYFENGLYKYAVG